MVLASSVNVEANNCSLKDKLDQAKSSTEKTAIQNQIDGIVMNHLLKARRMPSHDQDKVTQVVRDTSRELAGSVANGIIAVYQVVGAPRDIMTPVIATVNGKPKKCSLHDLLKSKKVELRCDGGTYQSYGYTNCAFE